MTGGLDPEFEHEGDTPTSTPPTGPAVGAAADVVVLAALREAKRPLSAAALAETTRLPVRNVQRALGKLVGERVVRKAGGGLFAVAARRPPSRRGRGGSAPKPGLVPDATSSSDTPSDSASAPEPSDGDAGADLSE